MVFPALRQRCESAGADLVDRALARDLPVARRARVALRSPFRIVVDKGPRLLFVDLEALPDGLLLVVLTLYQGIAGQIVLARRLRRIESKVIVAAGRGMH